ncbi:uncharacterized protein B0H18DRAFT_997012 [Fomitopsis serialis]|uniref:uncharacterized protein n=1 Tax=Fomitopsis serialis TaxID=139415 RepID=UPI00200817EC|nr:uncharacterized protein B0H18DRAFT_997012 [Neoantrodia serialis]KAH9929404.1 hypothetical protein B0H18DRAFT_997012 [Neoantrodia serialis]
MSESATATPAVEEVRMEVGDASSVPIEVKQTESGSVAVPPTVAKTAGDAGSDDKQATNGSDDEDKFRAARQIEFYFADSNLPFDKFMWTLHTANPEHWVPLSTVSSFKRMREWQKHGHAWIADALRMASELEVSEDGTKVRRRTEVQPPKDQFERSIYAKGFGTDEDGETQEKLESFFNKYGRTNAVRMRRTEDKTFKGSVFVEFTDFKSVGIFLNADPKPSWNGEELKTMTKEAYCEMKIKEKGLTGKAARMRKQSFQTGRGFNAFREMEEAKKNKDKKDKGKGKEEEKKKEPEVFIEFMGSKIRVEQGEEGGTVKDEDVPLVKGASLTFAGAGESVTFDEIKSPLKERFPRAPYVKHTRGESSGLVGFEKALTEDEIAYVKEHLKTLGGKDVSWSIPDEETERAFQLERAQGSARRAVHYSQSSRGSSRGRGGRGRGGRGGRGGGRGGGRTRSGPKENGAGAGAAAAPGEEQTGEKRKRAVEPDGGPTVGQRGLAVPVIQSAKKAKTDEGSS